MLRRNPDGTVEEELSSAFKTERYNLVFTPAPDAGPVTVNINLRFTDAFALKTPVTTPYRIQLTASVEAAVEESKVVPEVKPPMRIGITPKPDTEVARAPEAPPPPAPKPQPAALDYAPICKSAMTAIALAHEKATRAHYPPATPTGVKWRPEFTYDNGDCVGAYFLWYTDPADNKDYRTGEWALDTGAGRLKVGDLKKHYEKDYPDLQWTPTSSGGSTPAPSAPPPCPPEPLSGVGNQEANLRCFGIP